jgi:hypothetical protein
MLRPWRGTRQAGIGSNGRTSIPPSFRFPAPVQFGGVNLDVQLIAFNDSVSAR